MTKKAVVEEMLRNAMKTAGIYDPVYETQISETADAIAERKEMQELIKREGRILTEGERGKRVANPLIVQVNQYHRTITQQLSALGLNRLKKQQSEVGAGRDAMADFLGA